MNEWTMSIYVITREEEEDATFIRLNTDIVSTSVKTGADSNCHHLQFVYSWCVEKKKRSCIKWYTLQYITQVAGAVTMHQNTHTHTHTTVAKAMIIIIIIIIIVVVVIELSWAAQGGRERNSPDFSCFSSSSFFIFFFSLQNARGILKVRVCVCFIITWGWRWMAWEGTMMTGSSFIKERETPLSRSLALFAAAAAMIRLETF